MGGFSVGWYAEGITAGRRYWEDGKWYTADDKYYDPFSHTINPEYAYKNPMYKYSAVELFKGSDILGYLRTYEKYPQAEMIVKLGLPSSLALSKQILEKVGKDKAFRKFLGRNRDTLTSGNIYYISSILNAYKLNKSIDEIQTFEARKKALNSRYFKAVREIAKADYDRFFKYLDKQEINLTLYSDYLRACRELNVDMSKDKNRFPHNFMHEHDVKIDEMRTAIEAKNEQRRKEREEEEKHLVENFVNVASKYMPLQSLENGAYVVYIAQSPEQLVKEGEALHHCVGKLGYDKKFAKEQSLIFFVRSATATETPLATIEYDPKRNEILQFYANRNSKPDEAVTDYVNNVWLPHANKAIKKLAA
jgi:hypothetical protein